MFCDLKFLGCPIFVVDYLDGSCVCVSFGYHLSSMNASKVVLWSARYVMPTPKHLEDLVCTIEPKRMSRLRGEL